MSEGAKVFDLFVGQNARKQEILTPPELVTVVDHTFGRGLWEDVYPCPGSPATSASAHNLHALSFDAHKQDWPYNSFGNPPYRDLQTALESALKAHVEGRNVLFLVPVRTRRRWFCHAWGKCPVVAFLAPVRFVGYTNQFPENVCMMLWSHERAQGDRFMEAVEPHANLVCDNREAA